MALRMQLDMDHFRRGVADLVLHDLRKLETLRLKKRRSLGKKFNEDVPLMGLNEAIKSKHWMIKVLWALVFLICLAATTYFVYKIFDEYLNDPTATKVNMVRVSTYSFPQLILCIDTWLNADKALNMGLTKEAIHYALSYLIAPHDLFRPIDRRSNSSDAKQIFEKVYYEKKFKSLLHFYEHIALDTMDVLHNTTKIKDSIEFECIACLDYQLPKTIIDHNVCYKIRLEDVDGKLGQSYGWDDLIIRVPDLSRGLTRKKTHWRLYTYSNSYMKKLAVSAPFVSIQRGHTHTVRIASEHYTMLDKPKQPCVELEEQNRSNYSALSCAFDCIAQDVQRLCKCRVFNFDSDFTRNLSDYCNTYYMQDDWGVNENDTKGFKSLDDLPVMKCTAACAAECDVRRYDTDVDVHLSGQLMREEEAKGNDNLVKRNVSAAKIYFINADVLAGGILRFTEVYTYSFETLVGNIGGTCGIWIGVSIMTLVQLLTFCSKHFVGLGKRMMFWKKRKYPEPIFL